MWKVKNETNTIYNFLKIYNVSSLKESILKIKNLFIPPCLIKSGKKPSYFKRLSKTIMKEKRYSKKCDDSKLSTNEQKVKWWEKCNLNCK